MDFVKKWRTSQKIIRLITIDVVVVSTEQLLQLKDMKSIVVPKGATFIQMGIFMHEVEYDRSSQFRLFIIFLL